MHIAKLPQDFDAYSDNSTHYFKILCYTSFEASFKAPSKPLSELFLQLSSAIEQSCKLILVEVKDDDDNSESQGANESSGKTSHIS